MIGGAVITCVAGLFMILAYSGALNETSGGKNSRAQITTQTISTQSFTSPSKEYIYAGSRLVATEESSNNHGSATIGIYNSPAFFLRNSNDGGIADITFTFGPGNMGFIPIVGDWDKDGVDTIGVYDPMHAGFFLRNTNTGGIADVSFTYGPVGSGIVPLAGNWDGQ